MGIAVTVLLVIVVLLLLLQAGVTFSVRIQFDGPFDSLYHKTQLLAAVVMTVGAASMLVALWTLPWLATVGGVVGALGFLIHGGSVQQDHEDYVSRVRREDAGSGRQTREIASPLIALYVVEALLAVAVGIAYLFV